MPIETETLERIGCDNPKCPGPPAELSDTDRRGWLFVTAERYGDPVQQSVFCSYECAAAAAAAFVPTDLAESLARSAPRVS